MFIWYSKEKKIVGGGMNPAQYRWATGDDFVWIGD